MELIKKNIGLIVYIIICLVAAGVLIVYMRNASANAAEYEQNVARQKSFFQKIRRNDYTLNRDNVKIAEENAQLMKQRFYELRSWLAQHYTVPPEIPMPTSLECVEILKRELTAINESLRRKGVRVDSRANYLSFQNIATSMNLPAGPRVPAILRNLKIVKEVARIIGDSNVVALNDISRPMDLQVKKENLYTITPVFVSVTATPDHIQEFINRMQQQSRFLFFLRNSSFKSPDQAPRGTIKKFATTLNERDRAPGQRPRDARMAREPGPMDMGMPDMPMPPADFDGGFDMMNPEHLQRTGPGTDSQRQTILTKAALMAFEERLVTAELRFDLIEFIPPDEE